MQEEDLSADDPGRPLLQVPEHTEKALKSSFGRSLPNAVCLQTRKPFLFPSIEVTKCPKLNPVAKQLLQKDAKQADVNLAKLRSLMLDTVALLVRIVEEAQRNTLTPEQAAEVAKAALSLLGNASAHISKERRRKVIKCLNKKVHPLADEKEVFAEAAPLLLGKVFETKMKSHLESLKCLSGSTERDFR